MTVAGASRYFWGLAFLLVLALGIAVPSVALFQGPLLYKGCVVVAPLVAAVAATRPVLLAPLFFAFGFLVLFAGVRAYMVPVRFLELAAGWTALFMLFGNSGKALRSPRGILEWCFWLFPAIALASVWVLFAQALEAANATGIEGLFRMLSGSIATSSFYALASALRLALFCVLVWAMAARPDDSLFKAYFSGHSAGAAASILVALPGYLLSSGAGFSFEGRFRSFFPNPGWYAQYLCLAFAFLAWLLRGRGGFWPYFCAGVLVFGAAVVATMTRAAWLVFGLTVLAVAAERAWAAKGTAGRRPQLLGAAVVLSLLLLAAAGVYGYLAKAGSGSGPDLAGKLAGRAANFMETPRLTVFKSGILIGLEHPAIGYGFETYAWRYRQLMSTESHLSRNMPSGVDAYEGAHNLYVQLFCGVGGTGLALWLMLAWGSAVRLWRACRREDGFAGAALVSLLVFHAFGFFQEMTYVPAIWFSGLALVGVALTKGDEVGKSPGRAWPALALLAGFALMSALRPEPAPRDIQETQGLFPLENVHDDLGAAWSAGSASFLLMDEGPWGILVGAPGPLLARGALDVDILARDGSLLARLRFLPGDAETKMVRISPHAAKTGDRVYLNANRVFFPSAFGLDDQRILGPYVHAYLLR